MLSAFRTRNMQRRRTAIMMVRWRCEGFYAAAIWSGGVAVVRLSRSLQRQDNDIACMLVFGERADSVRVGGRLLRVMMLRRTSSARRRVARIAGRPAHSVYHCSVAELYLNRSFHMPDPSILSLTHDPVEHLPPCVLRYLRCTQSLLVPSSLCWNTKPLHKRFRFRNCESVLNLFA